MNESSDALFTAESVSNFKTFKLIETNYRYSLLLDNIDENNNNWMSVVKFPNLINITLLLQINNYPLKLSQYEIEKCIK